MANELDALVEKLQKEKAELLAKVAPLIKARNALVAQMQPLEQEMRELKAAAGKILGSRLSEIDKQLTQLGAGMAACCTDEKNLDLVEKTADGTFEKRVCRLCKRRHFTLCADAGVYSTKG